MGVGGVSNRFYLPDTITEFRDIFMELRRRGSREEGSREEGRGEDGNGHGEPFILGGGCNTIFPDRPFSRPIIHTEKVRGFVVDGTRIRVEAGLRIESLISIAIESGLAGLERFRGIPGTVGGAIAMNAGGSGREFGQLVQSIMAIEPGSGEIIEVPGHEVRWGYRSADLRGLVVVGATLELVPGDTERLRREAVGFLCWKSERQPLGSHNAGCIFRNPIGHSAGWLIERAGLKGKRVGAAVISSRHANFIINERGRASTSDVLKLVDIARARVKEFFDVELELEVVVAGDASAR